MDYSSPSSIRSPFSPRVIGGRRPIGSATKLAGTFGQADDLPVGDVIYKNPHMVLQSYGAPLPVTVTEALTFSRNEISGRMSSSWCWLVWGRRVLAWPLAGGAARELTLPQTDLAHSADLVMLLENGQAMPSCIGVSPEGLARYWPSVSQAGVVAEAVCELAGQECCELQRASRDSVVLCTTSRTLLLLTVDERPSISVRVLRGAGGVLGGLSRRVASLLFPSTPPSDAKLVGVVVFPGEGGAGADGAGGAGATEDAPLLALLWADCALQLWSQNTLHSHTLQVEVGGAEVCVEAAARGGPRTLLLLLSAAGKAPPHRYARATVSVEDPTSPRVTSLTGLAGIGGAGGAPGAGPGAAGAAPRMKLLPLQNTHLLYTPTTLTLLHRGELDLSSEGDSVVCASSAGNVAVLLSHKHGILRLTPGKNVPVESGEAEGSRARLYDANLAILEVDPGQLEATDAVGKLKLAFLHHVQGSTSASRALMAELAGSTTELTRLVLAVAEELLDDMPCGDPRWPRGAGGAGGAGAGGGAGQAAGVALGASSALQPQQQLRDKRRVLRLLADLLQHQPAGAVSAAAWAGLCALDERAAMAAALRRLQLQPEFAAHVDVAIQDVCSGEWVSAAESAALASGRLTPSDVCYRHVTQVWRVLASPRLQDPSILESCVRAAGAGRGAWPAPAPPPLAVTAELVAALQRMILSIGEENESQVSSDRSRQRTTRLEHALSAAQLLLSDASAAAHAGDTAAHGAPHASHDPAKLWPQLRRTLVRAFLEVGEKSRASLLAEKFADLEILVSMCVESGDLDRLYSYMEKYADQGMAELAAAGILDANGAVLARAVRTAPPALLRRLRARPALLAAALLSRGACVRAARLLLAVPRAAQTTASLAKLCLLATDADDDDEDAGLGAGLEAGLEGAGRGTREELLAAVEARLTLCEQQAALPGGGGGTRGGRGGTDRLMAPEEIVQVYLDSEPSELTEYDYKKALDVTALVADEELREHLRLKVFAASVVRDEWSGGVDAVDDYMFCKLLRLLLCMGGDAAAILPAREQLSQHASLGALAADPHFRFLLRHAYDMVQQDDDME